MAKHKAGLHKEVSTIFDGVWNPDVDNIPQSFEVALAPSTVYVHPNQLAVGHWPKEPKFATIIKAFKEAPGHIFRSRARREKKRLLSISKHLMINLPS
jgi:hypothetical protein